MIYVYDNIQLYVCGYCSHQLRTIKFFYERITVCKLIISFIILDQDKTGIWTKMKETWKHIEEPKLIVSVIGGAKNFDLDDTIEASFKATINKLSKLPNSFIITGGMIFDSRFKISFFSMS